MRGEGIRAEISQRTAAADVDLAPPTLADADLASPTFALPQPTIRIVS